jgi:hypothetical protein
MNRWIVVSAVALLAHGCAPVFSDLQSARLVRPGQVEVTPSASAVDLVEDGSEHVQNDFGLQVAAGVSDRVDVRARYTRVVIDQDDTGDLGVNVVGFGPKVRLIKDRLALAIPVGFAFGQDIESGDTWAVEPTLIGTLPIVKNLDVTVAGKYLAWLSADDADNLVAVNVGLGIGPPDKWVIRPEVGFLWNPGEEGHFRHLSLGFSFVLGQ